MPKILLIEDTLEMQKLIQTNLSARSYEVIAASDGEQGLWLAHRRQPDLILLDIHLPGMTGWEVLRTLKSDIQTKSIPVIVMTASELPNDAQRAEELGAAWYFAKPFHLHEFIAVIGKILKDKKQKADGVTGSQV
jgi:DNA-binding response OmpR family regulator